MVVGTRAGVTNDRYLHNRGGKVSSLKPSANALNIVVHPHAGSTTCGGKPTNWWDVFQLGNPNDCNYYDCKQTFQGQCCNSVGATIGFVSLHFTTPDCIILQKWTSNIHHFYHLNYTKYDFFAS